ARHLHPPQEIAPALTWLDSTAAVSPAAVIRRYSTSRPRKMTRDRDVTRVLSTLERMSSKRDWDNLARFGITAKKAYGVSIANIQIIAKRVGRDHTLAAALWKTG